jgi:hypothetical protein
VHAGPCLRRVQLRLVPREVRHLRRCRDLRCLLLQGVHTAGEGPGWVPEDRQPGQCEDRSLLRAQEVWLQEEMIEKMEFPGSLGLRIHCVVSCWYQELVASAMGFCLGFDLVPKKI